ncbi:hypothetical protein CEP52_009997 [Fusarium oligoseptatum]|uniref:FAD-binding PCMH-type domain-containing protein n=1 Tax=Fusarium oligoseptatum TaxID=2604345 RepID=A0A428TAN3_9HYPO|nr:hypothetical protein CEP52_009997 [Fusarium oligoseptatum]
MVPICRAGAFVTFLYSAAAFLHSPVKRQNDAAAFCRDFKDTHQNITYLPNEAKYTELNQDYFSATSWLGPACVIAPKTASDVSDTVKALVKGQIQFAIRGGGHMPIPNAANIDSSGVLVASASLNQLILDDEKETIEVGSGNKWTNVYEYLEPYKLAVVGGRAGLVGVPGFLLGGGISFFSNEHGWASANVVGFDCVLANGDIVSATAANEFSDLFWALRGGGNSFAIVTAVHLTTFSLPEVAVGEISYEQNVAEKFLDSTYDFAKFGSEDFKAGIEPRVQWIPSMGDPSYHAIIFYNGDSAAPSSLDNFTNTDNMGQASSTFRVRPSMYNWTEEADSSRGALRGLRARFSVVSIKANRQALQIIHDTFLDMVQESMTSIDDLVTSLAFVPITERFLTVSGKNGGDPMAVDPSQAPYIQAEQTLLWSSSVDDEKIVQFLSDFNANVTNQLSGLDNVLSPYLYLNYADDTQAVFAGYPAANTDRLKEIRASYDPEMTFTDLMPGGWKVEDSVKRTRYGKQ